MKKIILLFTALAIISGNAIGQHEKDTITYPNWRYFYPPLDTVTASPYTSTYETHASPGYLGYLQYKVIQPLTIYGIAVTPFSNGPRFYQTMNDNTRYEPDPKNVDSSALELYAVLIQQEDDQFVRVDSVRWHQREPDRYFKYQSTYTYWDGIHEVVVPVYEFFFKHPIVVHDSFYVGFRSDYVMSPNFDTALSNTSQWEQHYPQQWGWDIEFMCNRGIGVLTESDFATYQRTWYNEAWCKKRLGGQTLMRYSMVWGGILPIIVPPDTDAVEGIPVSGFHRDEDYEGWPTFKWNMSSGQTLYEVAYGPADQDLVNSRTTTHPRLVLRDSSLDATTTYAARCRARSHHVCTIHDTMAWSRWTDTVHFSLTIPDTHDVEGIKPTKEEDLGLNILPNPTSGLATVTSSYRMERIAVYDLQGHLIIEQPAKGESATLDVSHLPQGVYVLTAHTTAGIATKRLLVE